MARTEGVISNGFILKDIEINPQEATIIGPESIVERINKVYTQTIDINGKFSSFEVDVILDKLHEKVLIKDIGVVNVKISITPQLRGRVFNKIPIKIYGLPQRYKIETGDLFLDEIEFKGSLIILQNLENSEINPFIVITNVRTDAEIEVKIHIAPINGLTVVDFKPKIIKIKISER
jgi:YbbR domain-containing protein